MKLKYFITTFFILFLFSQIGWSNTETEDFDPFERSNRVIFQFNQQIDNLFILPVTRVYKSSLPNIIQFGITSVFNHVNLLPTIANDLLQAEWTDALKDSWRFIGNTSLGFFGLIDFAADQMKLEPHSNELRISFAKWGLRKSPFIMLPFFGPSTLIDTLGITLDYAVFTPYTRIHSVPIIYGLFGLRYLDVRAQLLQSNPLIQESIDPYLFTRDAYWQNRHYLIDKNTPSSPDDAGYLREENDLLSTSEKTSSITSPSTKR